MLMLLAFLIASVSTGATDTASIGPSSPTPINIINRCGSEGAVDHEFLVTLNKQDVANSDGRRLDTTEDKLSFLQGWVDHYTVDQHDSEGTYSNGTTRRKLEANSMHSTHVLHFFTETRLGVAVGASDEVRGTLSTSPARTRVEQRTSPRRLCSSHLRMLASDHTQRVQNRGALSGRPPNDTRVQSGQSAPLIGPVALCVARS